MPTVTVIKDELERLLGVQKSDEEWASTFMQFGLELDEVVHEKERFLEAQPEVVQYKVDVTANRSDLLCVEGLALAMRDFLGLEPLPPMQLQPPRYTLTVDYASTSRVRPYVVSAVVRNLRFNQRSYNSFIDHQDKLHQNLCRRRALVAIGTHDLDKLDPTRLTYAAEAPEDISFVALNQTEKTTGRELFDLLRHDKKLSEYLPLIEASPVWPVIRDARGEVLSLPPIINSEYSKIELGTRNVLIDATATDLSKAYAALNVLVNAMRVHSETPAEIEAVTVHYEGDVSGTLLPGSDDVVPHLEPRELLLDLSYIRAITGVSDSGLSADGWCGLLKRMGISASPEASGEPKTLRCLVPCSRMDVISPIDLVEGAAIAYGYNQIAERFARAPTTVSVGRVLPGFRLAEQLRVEAASCGYVELLLFSLCPEADSVFGEHVVKLSNAKTSMFVAARSSLVPGMLNALVANQNHPLPLKVFECAEVIVRDDQYETGATASRRFAAAYAGTTDGFEHVHGLLNQLGRRMQKPYTLEGEDAPVCLAGRRAKVLLHGKCVGWVGVLHPDVLVRYKVPFPCSVLELDFEAE